MKPAGLSPEAAADVAASAAQAAEDGEGQVGVGAAQLAGTPAEQLAPFAGCVSRWGAA